MIMIDVAWFRETVFSQSPSPAVSLSIVLVTVVTGYLYYDSQYSFFSSKGIKGPIPLPIFGNALGFFTKIVPVREIELYKKYGKLYGTYDRRLPIFNISDPEVIRNIMIRDFRHFVDRKEAASHRISKLFLTFLKGSEWKRARNIMTPTFTSAKMKAMMSLMNECVDTLVKSLTKKAKNKEYVDVKDVFGFYTIDVIAKCAFATDTKVQEIGYESEFMTYAVKFMIPTKWKMLVTMMVPKFLWPLFLKAAGGETINYMEDIVRNILQQRLKNSSTGRSYKDLLQLMIDAMKEKSLQDSQEDTTTKDAESYHVNEDANNNIKDDLKRSGTLSEDELVANAVLVVAAGYETTSTLLTYASYSLAMNPEKQQKLREEILSAYEAAGNKINYEDLSTLKYLDSVICETLRLYSPVVRIERQCTEDYSLEIDIEGKTKNFEMKKGDIIRFPLYAIHHDPKYYPNPDKWEPERFLPENKHLLTPYTYLPFGGGPRSCLGMRFALMKAKLALARTMLFFKFVPCDKTVSKPDMTQANVVLSAQNIIVKVEET